MKPSQDCPDVKFFIACLYSDLKIFESCTQKLVEKYGETDIISTPYPFDHTSYYAGEMGGSLVRRFISIKNLLNPRSLVDMKWSCFRLEEEFSTDDKRRINIDPGYLDTHKVVLASFKYGGWKLFLERGTYADITLHYRKGKFLTFDWTFPDFRSHIYDPFFMKMRHLYKKG